MKKILTLIISAAAFVSAFSQTNDEEARRVILGGKNKTGSTTETSRDRQNPRDVVLGGRNRRVYDEQGNRYPNGTGTRDQQIDQVNRDYDQKINSIRNNPTLSSVEKERIIRDLNNERAKRIRAINNNYKNRDKDDYDDDDDDDDNKKNKKYKKNNGNHYGWEKGKGNPHKSGKSKG